VSGPTFDDLLAEGGSVSVEGWDFSWFDGRATEERPPWGYARMMGQRMAGAEAVLDVQTDQATAAGLHIVDLREATLRATFDDIGADVHFLRKVIWIVPDFTVERYRTSLAELHRLIDTGGPFVAHARRFLIEARKPR
jgi:hypothetical protein